MKRPALPRVFSCHKNCYTISQVPPTQANSFFISVSSWRS
jgi:hypothetical protein